MIEGIDTGYEGKFDFPGHSAPPAITYMLASVPRSGSSYLSHLLWRTGCLGAPIEYLNHDPAGPYGFAAHSADQQQFLWRSVLRRRTSPNGVFGFKAFPSQLETLQETNPPLLQSVLSAVMAGRPPRILHLARRDRTAHMVSYARATISGVWRQEQERFGAEEPDYSETAMANAAAWIESQEAAWEAMFRDLRIEPLRLWYEDVVADPGKAIGTVAAWLGVAIDAAAAVDIPPVLKQNEAGANAWLARHRGVQRG